MEVVYFLEIKNKQKNLTRTHHPTREKTFSQFKMECFPIFPIPYHQNEAKPNTKIKVDVCRVKKVTFIRLQNC